MKKVLSTVMLLFLLLQVVSCKAKDKETREINQNTPEIVKVPFGDPFIMLWEDKYYAYGTYSSASTSPSPGKKCGHG